MHPAIVEAWVRAAGTSRVRPMFAVGRSNESRLLLPLVIMSGGWRQGRVKLLAPPGGDLFDYHDPVQLDDGPPPDTSNRFWAALLRGIEGHSAPCFDVIEILRRRMPKSSTGAEVAPYVDLRPYESFATYLRSRGGSFQYALRRKTSKLRRLGKVSLRVYGPGEATEAIAWLPDILKEKRRRYPTASLDQPYLEHLLAAGLPAGLVHFSTLKVGEQTASWHIGFCLDRAFYYYMPCLNGAFAHVSAGVVHLYELFDWCFDHRYECFDFLRGSEAYKYHWTDGAEVALAPLRHVILSPGSLGRAGLAWSIGFSARAEARLRREMRAAGSWARRLRRSSN
jgi:CelD/BcsL family acetyltransferase involved in cellulose biosynthesis